MVSSISSNESSGLPAHFGQRAADHAEGLRDIPPDEIALNINSFKTISPETLAGACRWIMDGLAACGLASYDDPDDDMDQDLVVG